MGGMGDQESDSEVTGVMIDPKGLVLCSNTQLGGFTGIMKQFMGPMGVYYFLYVVREEVPSHKEFEAKYRH